MVTLIRFAVDAAREREQYDRVLEWLDRLPPTLAGQPAWLSERADALAALGFTGDAFATYQQALDSVRALPPARRDVPAFRALEAGLRQKLVVASRSLRAAGDRVWIP